MNFAVVILFMESKMVLPLALVVWLLHAISKLQMLHLALLF